MRDRKVSRSGISSIAVDDDRPVSTKYMSEDNRYEARIFGNYKLVFRSEMILNSGCCATKAI